MKAGFAGSLLILLAAHLAAALAGFLAPYPPGRQHRDFAWQPPTVWTWSGGELRAGGQWPVRWGRDGKLFSVDEPGHVFLLGTDALGRDQFSRLLHGARISLYSGLAAAAVSAFLGFWLGGLAGFLGGWTDRLLMGLAELFLVLPWMYLLLAARAFFPLNTDPGLIFLALLLLLGAVGWARPARLVRNIVLSARERDYVLAARGFGAGNFYLLRNHVLPPALPAVLTYLTVAIPQYIAAEATLSFLGLGFSGTVPSWGNLISALASLEVLGNYWWMWIPAVALILILACYSNVSNGLRTMED